MKRHHSAITFDPEFIELIPQFIAQRRRELGVLEKALEEGDYGLIRIIGHNMKGSGASFGFPEISAIGRSIESAASEGDKEALPSLLKESAAYIEKLELAFKEHSTGS